MNHAAERQRRPYSGLLFLVLVDMMDRGVSVSDWDEHIEGWSTVDVASFFRSLGRDFDPTVGTCLTNAVDGKTLLHLLHFDVHPLLQDPKELAAQLAQVDATTDGTGSDVVVILVGGARTIATESRVFASMIESVFEPLGNADLYAALKTRDPGPSFQRYKYEDADETALLAILESYDGFRGAHFVNDGQDWEEAMLSAVAMRSRFTGFLADDNNLARAVANTLNFYNAYSLLMEVERAQGRAYKYVVAMRADIYFPQDPSVTQLGQSNAGAFRHWSTQPAQAFIIGSDWGFFMPRPLVLPTLTHPYLTYINQSLTPSDIFTENEDVVRKSCPHLLWCAMTKQSGNPCLPEIMRPGGVSFGLRIDEEYTTWIANISQMI